MSNKKRMQILAAALCATTMASFYGAPKVEAMKLIYDTNTKAATVESNATDVDGITLKETTDLTVGNVTIGTSGLTVGATSYGINASGVATLANGSQIGGVTMSGGGLTLGNVSYGITSAGVAKLANTNITGTLTTTGAATIGGDLIIGSTATKITSAGVATLSGLSVGNGTSGSFNVKTIGVNQNMIFTDGPNGNTLHLDPKTGNLNTKGTVMIGGLSTDDGAKVLIDGTTGTIRVGGDLIAELGSNLEIDASNGNLVSKGALSVADGKFVVDINTGNTLIGSATNNTRIHGSAITSTKSATDTGVLDGSTLTLTHGASTTKFTAGGAAYTGTAGRSAKKGTNTTIDGGIITTDTLNVQRIELGENIVDDKGNNVYESNLSINADGSMSAASGNFTVAADGSVDNTIFGTNLSGHTTATGVHTNVNGFSATHINASTGNSGLVLVTSEYTVTKVGNENVFSNSIIDDNSISNYANGVTSVMTGGTDGSIVDAVGNTTVTTTTDGMSVIGTTTGYGMEVKTDTGDVTFTGNNLGGYKDGAYIDGGATETIINGNSITTGQITTDKLVITGTEAPGGTESTDGSSLALGGDGSISGIAKNGDAATAYVTNADGQAVVVTDGNGNTNSNTMLANGTTQIVSDGSTATGVFTNAGGFAASNSSSDLNQQGQILVTKDGILDKVEDKTTGKASSTAQNSTSIEMQVVDTTSGSGTKATLTEDSFTVSSSDSNNAATTTVTSGDVNIKTDDYDISLSQMGQVDDILEEVQAREEYDGTVVGGLNSESAIRREEIARLDSRIDKTDERLDRVGAMAAAAASLKSMGYDPAAPTEFAIGLGTYKGSQAVAVGLFHYPNRDFMMNINYTQSGSEKMGGIGATWKFGRKNPDRVLDDQLKERQKKVQIAREKAEAAQKLAKEAAERAAYAAKQAEHAKLQADTAANAAAKSYADKEAYDEYKARKEQ